MKPVMFKGHNVIFAKDQPEYIPLPARVHDDGLVETCWALTWGDRIRFLLGGRLWISIMTFNRGLQPIKPSAEALRALDAGGKA